MDHSHKPRRPKSREVSSRFLSPTTAETTTITPPLSPARRKPGSPITDTRKPRSQLDDPGSIRGGGLWPSSTTPSIKSFDTLAQHLGNDRLKDRIDRKNSLFHTQTIPTEAKENHRPILGGSTRYTGKFKFSGKSSPSSSSASTSSNKLSGVIVPGRFSVDGNALYQNSSRRRSDTFGDSLDSGSECSDACSGTDINIGSPNFGVQSSTASSRKLGMEVSSKYMNDIHTKHRRWTSDANLPNSISAGSSPKFNKFNLKNVIKRANSLTGSKFGTSQWALSPGRTGSAPVSAESMGKTPSFSSLKPPNSLSKTKGVEKLLHLGLDLFKSKKSSSSSRSLVRSNSGHTGVTDMGHQLRLLQNRLMQWRYANARAGIVNGNIADQAQSHVLNAWDGLMKLRQSVLHKKLKFQKEKLEMKLNFILHSQFKPLEAWGDTEKQHMGAVCMMKECLHSVLCRVPLTEGAEVDTQSAAINLRHASDLSASINLMLATYAPSAEQTVSLLSELAEVVAQEKLLSDECLELCRTISTLEVEERSLKCSIIQLESWKQQQIQLQQQQPREEDITP